MRKTEIEINGDIKTLEYWCKIYGTNQDAVRARISRGWDKFKAITTPTIPKSPVEDKLMKCETCGKEFMSRYRKGDRNSYEKHCSFNCAQAARATHHGHARKKGRTTPEYHAWEEIKQRCTNENNPAWKDYGGRGITLHNEWIESFEKFFECVGNRPTPKHQIDRIDNNLGYIPGNVKWSTKKEQMRNRRNTMTLTVNGETKPLIEWAEIYNIKYVTLVNRIKRDKMDPLAALTTPNRDNKYITINGEKKPLQEWLKIYNQSYFTMYGRMKRGWSEIEAITIPSGESRK